MKRAKSIFLWCGEQGERWRGWLPHWGFSAKWVLTFSNKHHLLWCDECERKHFALRQTLDQGRDPDVRPAS